MVITLNALINKPYTANILTVLSTAFGSVTCATVILLYVLQPKIAIDLKLYSSISADVTFTVVVCDNHFQIIVAQITQPMTVNWLFIHICSQGCQLVIKMINVVF